MELLVLILVIGIFLGLITLYIDKQIERKFKKYDIEMHDLRHIVNMIDESLELMPYSEFIEKYKNENTSR